MSSKGKTVRSSSQPALATVAEAGLALTRGPDPQTIARLVSKTILRLCDAEYAAFFYELAHGAKANGLLVAVAQPNQETVVRRLSPEGDGASWPRIAPGDVLRSLDIASDPRFTAEDRHLYLCHGIPAVRSLIAAPILDAEGRTAGAILCGHAQPNFFQESSEDLVATVAAQASISMENVRLRDELKLRASHFEEVRQDMRDHSDRLDELAAIVSSSGDAIIGKDLNGVITSWNQAATRIFGYSTDEIIGKSILQLIPEHLHSNEFVLLGRIRSGERIDHFETVRRTKSGELIDVSLTISPVRNQQGVIVGASKILRDISATKRAERSLLQAEKIAAAGRMAATIAHEINNPLEAVVNLLYLLRDFITDPAGAGYLKTAETELARVSHIARQTLGFYREHGSARKTSLTELVRHTISVYEPRCSATGISIESSLQTKRELIVRRGEIMQVVSNLVANSIHAMPNGGILTVDVHDVADGVVLSIRDNGIGIASRDLPRVFEAFFTTRFSIGTGIGLFVSKQFVEGHGGKISIESSQDKDLHGTTVTVFLPEITAYDERANGVEALESKVNVSS